ncbi:DUF4286 family protein [Pontibacter cellulosilyticus]|uniref:DUF4286 family protein n=1 Tax=Pontibacter cellulosilyticus TaxID=1720253 RepID=A0A923N6Q8_9BACT|nr:DUF4286 family protein [Pontibacter cellulosilyticus]MBC5993915.1 DUF4286 family protein [Pontibacter cellulosilyticus]
MIIYNVTVSIDNTVADEWLQWMLEEHIPEVMGTGYFLGNQICRVMEEEDTGGTTYAVQYTCRSLEDLLEYQRDHSPALQQKANARYAGKYASFRTVLDVVGVNVERKDQA